MKEGWLKILKLVTLEITIFGKKKKFRILSGRPLKKNCSQDKRKLAEKKKLLETKLTMVLRGDPLYSGPLFFYL